MKSETISPYKLLIAFLALLAIAIAFFAFKMFSPEPEVEQAAIVAPQATPAPLPPARPPESLPTLPTHHDLQTPGRPGILSMDESDEQIALILSDPTDDFDVLVQNLWQLLPRLPEEGQMEAAQHMANLSSDEIASGWMEELTEQKLPPAAAEVLFNDMLNRPHEIIMPVMGRIADQAAHPLQNDSQEILEVLFGLPPEGQSWEAWINQTLAEENL